MTQTASAKRFEIRTTKSHSFNIGATKLTVPIGTDQDALLNDAATFLSAARGMWTARSSLSAATTEATESVESAQVWLIEMAQAMVASAHQASFAARVAIDG